MARGGCVLALLVAPLLAGCVNQSLALRAGPAERRTSPADVELHGTNERPFEALGKVHAHCRTNWLAAAFNCGRAGLEELVRMRAAELGADGVVGVERTGFWQIEWSEVHLRGMAVRWTD